MRDYWLTQYFLSVIGWGYVAVVLIALALAIWMPKRKRGKAIASAIVLGIAAVLPFRGVQQFSAQRAQADEFRLRYGKAKAVFEQRCRSAGEKIYRRIDGIDGVLLMNVRQSSRPGVGDDPNWADAALPLDATGEQYIRHFLYNEYDGSPPGTPLREGERGFLNVGVHKSRPILSLGYAFVDVLQSDGSVWRYRLESEEKSDLVREPVNGKPARYGIGFKNQVNPEDRMHWVAGTTIVLSDTHTNEVLASRESYSFEPGLGSTGGGRQPWRFAVTCPAESRALPSLYLTRFFADQVLKPRQSGRLGASVPTLGYAGRVQSLGPPGGRHA